MILTYSSRGRVRHRYYVSAPCIRGQTDEPLGFVTRVPASELEATISKAVIANTDIDDPLSNETLSRETLERFVTRIEVRKNQLAINLRFGENEIRLTHNHHDPDPAEQSRDHLAHRRRTLEEATKAHPRDLAAGEYARASRPAHEGRTSIGSDPIDRPRPSLASGDHRGPRDDR